MDTYTLAGNVGDGYFFAPASNISEAKRSMTSHKNLEICCLACETKLLGFIGLIEQHV